jgi:2-amino-4-hydroxy-6-hydroxymethyldihydropteridine diphosphokinase
MKDRWYPAYIGVGSNLESPVEQVRTAFGMLGDIALTQVVRTSSLYRSSPLGPADQPDYINAVAAILTQLEPPELLVELQQLESAAGRVRGERWGPRVLDLDLLAWSNRVVDSDSLTLPHPGIAERNFVLLPWREITPFAHVPGIGTVDELAKRAPTEPRIERLD